MARLQVAELQRHRKLLFDGEAQLAKQLQELRTEASKAKVFTGTPSWWSLTCSAIEGG
jgi:hypothetical protein